MSTNSSNSSINSLEEGNTETSSKKQSPIALRWLFTLNNYKEDEVSSTIKILEKNCRVVSIGYEVGELGTPHLQGYCEFTQKRRPRLWFIKEGGTNRIHWGDKDGLPCKKWCTREHNVQYTQKEGNVCYVKNVPKIKKLRLIDPTYDWEQEILKIVGTEPDDRTIHWYWGVGNLGKTSFCKYLTANYGAIALSGKAADMRNGIIEYAKTNCGETPELVLINIPRSFDLDYISYEGIENVKDMYFYSGKYEGGMVCGNCPHIFVFANEPPKINKLSMDRWVVREIENG